MRVLDAAIQVLQEAGEPLRVEAITERILSRGLWQTAGKTPVATVGAALYTDVKRRGSASPFVRRGSGTFGLRQAAALAKPDEVVVIPVWHRDDLYGHLPGPPHVIDAPPATGSRPGAAVSRSWRSSR